MPRLPKNLQSTHQQYKVYTDNVAQSLATLATSRGYTLQNSKRSSSSVKVPQKNPTYTIPTREWIPMAEFVAALMEPPVTIATEVAAWLYEAINLRQAYSKHMRDNSVDTAGKNSNHRHAFFTEILVDVRSILSPLMLPAAIQMPTTTGMDNIFDMFEQLQSEKTLAATKEVPGTRPVSVPIYQAEHLNNDEEDFFVLYLLLRDLERLRTEVSKAWESYKQNGHDLIAASITTNLAVDIAQSMIEDLNSIFARHGGPIRMLQIYFAFQCIAKRTKQAHRQRVGDEMSFSMFDIADAMFWPAYILLDGFSSMDKWTLHPGKKPSFYGTYDPSSDRDRKSSRDKFREDKILLSEILRDFYLHYRETKDNPPSVEDRFTHLLRDMFETQQVTFPLAFAATLFLDIHHSLRVKVGKGFRSLTEATCFVISDLQEELKFHKNINMGTWPKHNDDAIRSFVKTVRLWVHQDEQLKMVPQNDLNNTSGSFYPYRKHPWSCGLCRYWVLMQFHEFGIAFANAWGSIMSCAHLYNAVNGGKSQGMKWRDLDAVISLHNSDAFFPDEPPATLNECLKRFVLAMGGSSTDLAKSMRMKPGLIHSKTGIYKLRELGATMQIFRSHICKPNGHKGIRAEDVLRILENSDWRYDLDNNGNVQQVFKDFGEIPEKSSPRSLSVSKCVGLVRDLVHAEVVEIAFDYFRLHRQCWRLLRAVKHLVHDDLVKTFGPEYMQKESELPFIVGYVLMTASATQKIGQLLKNGQPGLQVDSKVLEGARSLVELLVQSKGGGLVVEQTLPQALGLQIVFRGEGDSGQDML